MGEFAIRTEKLGKKYRLGALSEQKYGGYDFLGFQLPLQRLWSVLLDQGATPDDKLDFWALRDLDLEVRTGEVLGIIGKNGSGKSTLLKILARVTEPSAGLAEVTGQVGSLLEVGTGFHPDLTGRQNVYLNGSIMGMTHDQIDRRFDEIVNFAEVESFIDTPVKHYSSGMYMRLAFAVAAHMECDVLIVDEVLAVGDAHFQRKCLARLDSEVRSGKTVLFVSHNTSTIMQICTRCVLFENGRLIENGLPQPVVESYLSRSTPVLTDRRWTENAPMSPTGHYRLWAFKVVGLDGETRAHFDVKEPIIAEMEWEVLVSQYPITAYVSVRHESGVTVFTTVDNHDSPWTMRVAPAGYYRARLVIPANFLNEGMFMLDFAVTATNRTSEYISCSDAATFYVVDDMKNEGVRGNWDRKWFTSVMRPQLKWTHLEPAQLQAAK